MFKKPEIKWEIISETNRISASLILNSDGNHELAGEYAQKYILKSNPKRLSEGQQLAIAMEPLQPENRVTTGIVTWAYNQSAFKGPDSIFQAIHKNYGNISSSSSAVLTSVQRISRTKCSHS